MRLSLKLTILLILALPVLSLRSSAQGLEPERIILTVITSKDCRTCDTARFIGYLKNIFPGLQAEYLYYPDSPAAALVKKNQIISLPAYILEKKAEAVKNFAVIKDGFELKNGNYLARPAFSGLGMFLNRKKTGGSFDVFISLFDPNSPAVISSVKEFKPAVHFLAVKTGAGFEALRGDIEIEEDLRSVCVQKYYPEKFWDYISCRANKPESAWWEDCLAGNDTAKIKACAKSAEGVKLLEENTKDNKELGVMVAAAYLVDNVEIFSSDGAPARETLKKLIKR